MIAGPDDFTAHAAAPLVAAISAVLRIREAYGMELGFGCCRELAVGAFSAGRAGDVWVADVWVRIEGRVHDIAYEFFDFIAPAHNVVAVWAGNEE